VHDRPWPERPVFGKIRCMTYNGCRSKFDVDAYVKRWTLDES
jgi:deoxyribodipyrimidine photo-lyase